MMILFVVWEKISRELILNQFRVEFEMLQYNVRILDSRLRFLVMVILNQDQITLIPTL